MVLLHEFDQYINQCIIFLLVPLQYTEASKNDAPYFLFVIFVSSLHFFSLLETDAVGIK
jgi:hypothetical protein